LIELINLRILNGKSIQILLKIRKKFNFTFYFYLTYSILTFKLLVFEYLKDQKYMAHHKSTIKRIRTSLKQRAYNRQYRSQLATMIKSIMNSESKEAAESKLPSAYKLIDQLVHKNIIHKNKAAHQKSRLARHVTALS